jgi:hypothetical protein
MNVVGALYVRLMTRFMRRRPGHPADMEAVFARGRRTFRPRNAVISVLGYYVLDVSVACILPSVALILLARASNPIWVHDVATALGALIVSIPLGLYLGVFVWSILPGSSPGSYYAEPARLMPASVLAWIGWLVCAPLVWLSLRG